MGAHRRWRSTEKAARVANGFERQPVVVTSDPFGPLVGVSMYPPSGPSAADVMAAQEAYELIEIQRRRRA